MSDDGHPCEYCGELTVGCCPCDGEYDQPRDPGFAKCQTCGKPLCHVKWTCGTDHENAALKQERDGLKAEVERLRAELAQVLDDYSYETDNLTAYIEDLQARRDELKQDTAEWKARAEKAEAELRTLKSQLSSGSDS